MSDGRFTGLIVFSQGEVWRNYSRSLYDFNGIITLEGWTGKTLLADLAIDNLRITSGECTVDEGGL